MVYEQVTLTQQKVTKLFQKIGYFNQGKIIIQ